MSVSLSPIFNGWQGFYSNGRPLNAGLINTYIAGGTTPQATYTTSSGGTPCANPIVLGADGRPTTEIWLTDGQSYRFDLTDALGNLIKTYDNITGAGTILTTLAASSGSSLVGYIQAGTGAVATTAQAKMRQVVSGQDYGMVDDGTTNNVSAYGVAVAAITASGVKTKLYLPCISSGSYKFNTGITLDRTLMSIDGETVEFDFTSLSTTGTALTITGSVGDTYSPIEDVLSGVKLVGPSASSGSSIGIYFNSAAEPGPSHITLRNVGVTAFVWGATYGANAYIITFDHCSLWANARGFQTHVGASTNSGERITFINSSLFNNTAYGLRVEDSNADIYCINSSFDYNYQAQYLSAGFIHNVASHFEFADQIGGNDPLFLYADNGAGNTGMVSYTGCTFMIGVVAVATNVPVFQGLNTVTVSHTNSQFYLNTNRNIIFSMAAGTTYSESGARIDYLGTTFRSISGSYTIMNAGLGGYAYGITTSDAMAVANPTFIAGSVGSITDVFNAAYATGQVATSNVALGSGVYMLYTHTQTSSDIAVAGVYVIQKQGTGTTVTAITNDASITVAVNGSYLVTITNASGDNRVLDGTLIRQSQSSL